VFLFTTLSLIREKNNNSYKHISTFNALIPLIFYTFLKKIKKYQNNLQVIKEKEKQ